MDSPFEIKNHPDSGDIIIKTEGDMNAIARADEIVKGVYRQLPKGKCFSGGISKEDVDKAQKIAEELDSMALYSDRCFSDEEYDLLVKGLNLEEGEPLPPMVKPEAIREFTKFVKSKSAAELKEIVDDAQTKGQAVDKLVAAFSAVKPTRLGRQARASFGRLKLARNKLSYAHPRQSKNTEEA